MATGRDEGDIAPGGTDPAFAIRELAASLGEILARIDEVMNAAESAAAHGVVAATHLAADEPIGAYEPSVSEDPGDRTDGGHAGHGDAAEDRGPEAGPPPVPTAFVVDGDGPRPVDGGAPFGGGYGQPPVRVAELEAGAAARRTRRRPSPDSRAGKTA